MIPCFRVVDRSSNFPSTLKHLMSICENVPNAKQSFHNSVPIRKAIISNSSLQYSLTNIFNVFVLFKVLDCVNDHQVK